MPTQDSVQFVPLSQGIDTKSDPNTLQPGKLVVAENVSFNTPGRLEKRTGTRSLPRTTTENEPVSSSLGVSAFNTDLVHFDGQRVRQWVNALQRWVDAGHCNPIALSSRWLNANPELDVSIGNNVGITSADVTSVGGINYTVYNTSGTLKLRVDDALSDTFSKDVELSTDAMLAQVSSTDSTAFVFFVKATAKPGHSPQAVHELSGSALSPINPELRSTVGLVPLFSSSNETTGDWADVYDVLSDTTATYIAYKPPPEVSSFIKVSKFNNNLEPLWTTTTSISYVNGDFGAGNRSLSLALGADVNGYDTLALTAGGAGTEGNTGNLFHSVLNPQTGHEVYEGPLITQSTTAEKLASTLVSGTLNVWWQEPYSANSASSKAVRRASNVIDVVAPNLTGSNLIDLNLYDVHLASKAWTNGDRSFVTLCFSEDANNDGGDVDITTDNPTQNTFFIEDTEGNLVGRMLVGEAFVWPIYPGGQRFAPLSKVISTQGSSFTGALFRRKFGSTATVVDDVPQLTPIIGLTSINVTHDVALETQQQSNNLLIVGGYPKVFDGTQVTEHGFNAYPTILSATASYGHAGQITVDGDYIYCFTYEWTDAEGQTHQSAPSNLLTIPVYGATSGSGEVGFQVKQLHLTEKDNVRLVGYRSPPNPDGDTQSLLHQFTLATDTSLVNDPTLTAPFDLVDRRSVDDISANRDVYTAGGELDNAACPPCLYKCATKNRIFVAGGGTSAEVFYSKLQRTEVPIEFALELSFIVDRSTGPITGMAAIDDKLYVFKSTRTYFTYGDGPDNTGNGQFNEPQLASSDTGCTNARSIVNVPGMILFESSKGVYSVDGNGTFDFIGAPARDLFAGKTIVGAQPVPGKTQVRFALAEGGCVVYDYFYQQWCFYTHSQAAGSTVWDDTYAYAKTDGSVVIDDDATFSDDSRNVLLHIKTGRVLLAGAGGFWRIKRLAVMADYVSPHSLRVKVYFDGNPAPSQDVTFDVDSVVQPTTWGGDSVWGQSTPWGGSYNSEILALHLTKQKCNAVQFEIKEEDAEGEGLRLRSIGLLAGAYPGLVRTRDANRR